MKKIIHEYLESLEGEVYLLHCDIWNFTSDKYNIINFGIQEPNMLNVATGLLLKGKSVFIFSYAGFVIYKSYEQFKYNIIDNADRFGSFVLFNSGSFQSNHICGKGHIANDIFHLLEALPISYSKVTDIDSLKICLKKLNHNFGSHVFCIN